MKDLLIGASCMLILCACIGAVAQATPHTTADYAERQAIAQERIAESLELMALAQHEIILREWPSSDRRLAFAQDERIKTLGRILARHRGEGK